MALKITNWDWIKILFFIWDFSLLILNSILFILISSMIYNEYYTRGSLKLFFTPFLVSLANTIIDFLMNIINFKLRYAGHNRYGMITRFFMFYFIMTIIIYSDQRAKYILIDNIDTKNKKIILLGIIDIGFLFISMIFSFFVVDVESFRQMVVRKKRSGTKVSIDTVKSLQKIEITDIINNN